MELDRSRQRALLERLASTYPGPCDDVLYELRTAQVGSQIQLWGGDTSAQQDLLFDLHYLREHALVSFHVKGAHSAMEPPIAQVSITAKGLDFLAEDGGLSAILGVLTVKLHDDTIKALLQAKIADSDLPASQKRTLINRVKGLGADATKKFVEKLISVGADALVTGGSDLIGYLEGLAP